MLDKWSAKEDKLLESLVTVRDTDWKEIYKIFETNGLFKSEKQIKERWIWYLDPSLKKKKWTIEENKKLFKLHQKIGNKWKIMAEYFPGRRDNAIKNQFFSLIRKSLRISRKLIGKSGNTYIINNVKPKAICEFIKKKINITFPKSFKMEKKKQKININLFFQKFSYGSIKELTINKIEKFIINKCINFLMEINNNYIERKNGRKKKIKKLKDKEIEKKISMVDLLNFNSNNNIKNFSEELELLIQKKKQYDTFAENLLKEEFEDENHRLKMIDVFKKLTECTNTIKDLILKSSDSDYKKFFNDKKKNLVIKNLYFLNNEEICSLDKNDVQSEGSNNFSRLNSFNRIFPKDEFKNQSKNSIKDSKHLTGSVRKEKKRLNIPSFRGFTPNFNFINTKYHRIKTDEIIVTKKNIDFFNGDGVVNESHFGKNKNKNSSISKFDFLSNNSFKSNKSFKDD